ncbi:MAG: hypothetical protein ACRESK_04040, partial [Gammaproteobacteria bacterium]
VMNQFPMVQLEQITWSANDESAVNVTIAEVQQSDATAAATGDEINGTQSTQTAILYGSIHAFDGDYRKALDMIAAFSAALKNTSQVRDVTILSLPLDVAPEASLEGSSVAVPATAGFSIRIVMESHVET